jgi:hypothetical protein
MSSNIWKKFRKEQKAKFDKFRAESEERSRQFSERLNRYRLGGRLSQSDNNEEPPVINNPANEGHLP